MEPSVYIAFEGAEACGKSTQARLLAIALDGVLTRETGGTRIGQRLRDILHDVEHVELDAVAETLIVAADRAQHLAEVVRPALAAGRPVVSDRSVFSTLAYQGYGRGLPIERVRAANDWAVAGTLPELVVLLDLDPDEAARRMRGRVLDRFERAGADFHARVRAGFLAMAADDPRRWLVLDASQPVDSLADSVLAEVVGRFGPTVSGDGPVPPRIARANETAR